MTNGRRAQFIEGSERVVNEGNSKDDSDSVQKEKIPRIELIPTLMLLPLLLVFLIGFSLNSDFWGVINNEALTLTKVEAHFAGIFIVIATLLSSFCVHIIVWVLIPKKRKKVSLIMLSFPIIINLVIDIGAAYAIGHDDILTFSYLFQTMGRTLGVIVDIALIASIFIAVFYLVYGVKIMWKHCIGEKNSKNPKFRPRLRSLISIAGFFIASYIPFFLVINHTSVAFWYIALHEFNWYSIWVIILLFFAAVYTFLQITNQISKSKYNNEKIQKLFPIFASVAIIPQIVSIVFIALSRGVGLTLLNPLSLLIITQIFISILKDLVIPLIKKNKRIKIEKKKTITRILTISIAFSLVWVIFYQPLITPVPFRPELEYQPQNIVKSNSYSNLTATQFEIFNGTLSYYISPDWIVNGTFDGSSRTMVRVADGLLYRNSGIYDIANASLILELVLEREVSEADTNWYAFRGADLIILLENHASKLDAYNASLVSALHELLIRGAELMYELNVRPSYTNIAMLTAFVLQYVGTRFDIPHILNAGIIKAWEIYTLFNRYNTFSEYNSQTYYGVDLIALAQWREYGPTEEMRAMGSQMEHALWIEMSESYHAGLKNFVGPYNRAYGMDITQYVPINSIMIAVMLNNVSLAPYNHNFTYGYFEFSNIFPIVEVGHVIPDEPYLSRFTIFSGPRYIERVIPAELFPLGEVYKATATITENWMMGGIYGRRKEDPRFRVATIHWNSTINNTVAWMMGSGLDVLDAKVLDNKLTIYRGSRNSPIIFYINCHNLTNDMFNTSIWELPGLKIHVEGDYSKITAEIVDSDVFDRRYKITGDLYNVTQVICDMESVSLVVSE